MTERHAPRPDALAAFAGNPGPWILAGAALASSASHAVIAAALARGRTFAQAFREAQEDRFQRALAVARAGGEPAAEVAATAEAARAEREEVSQARFEALEISLAQRREQFEAELQERRLAVERELAQARSPSAAPGVQEPDRITAAEVTAAFAKLEEAAGVSPGKGPQFDAGNIAAILNGDLPWPGRHIGASFWVERAGGPDATRRVVRGEAAPAVPVLGDAGFPGGGGGPRRVCVPVGVARRLLPGAANRIPIVGEFCVGPDDALFTQVEHLKNQFEQRLIDADGLSLRGVADESAQAIGRGLAAVTPALVKVVLRTGEETFRAVVNVGIGVNVEIQINNIERANYAHPSLITTRIRNLGLFGDLRRGWRERFEEIATDRGLILGDGDRHLFSWEDTRLRYVGQVR